MSGDIEQGICEVCYELKPLQRTYFRYDIKCACHSPNHFELVKHCSSCIPKEPVTTRAILITGSLKKIELMTKNRINELSKLQQPTVISTVCNGKDIRCDKPAMDRNGNCRNCGGDMQTVL